MRLHVDFGEDTEGGLLTALPGRWLEVGETVVLYDGDGNNCFGVVESMTDALVYVRPKWDTWVAAEIETAQSAGTGARFAPRIASTFAGNTATTAKAPAAVRISFA